MGRNSSKTKYNYLNGIEGEAIEENAIKPQVEEEVIAIEEVESKENKQPAALYSVKVTHPSLRRRSEPEVADNIVGLISDKGIYNIYAEVGGWGKLEDGSWIMLQFTKKISE